MYLDRSKLTATLSICSYSNITISSTDASADGNPNLVLYRNTEVLVVILLVREVTFRH